MSNKAEYAAEFQQVKFYHGNPNPTFQVGDIIKYSDEGDGTWSDLYMTPELGLARQFTEPMTKRQATKWGNGATYRLWPLDEPVLNVDDYPDEVVVYTCKRARVVKIM